MEFYTFRNSMRERDFIKQNATKWNRFEKLENSGAAPPDELADLYIELTDDLSYSRTHYPHRSVRVYLNTLAQRAFNKVQKNRVNTVSKLVHFVKTGLPLESYAARKSFLWSLVIFTLSIAIGVFSQHVDPNFLGLVVGDGYLDETLKNISEGDPMKIYKSGNGMYMSTLIAVNNIRVSFLLFVLGLTFGLGTSFVLIFNGIMLGSFQYFFVQHGLGKVSFLAIWIHGALEISAIVIAGGAGLLIGKSLAFPGTLSRGQSAQIAAKKATKIMVGLLPIFITAALLEGYVTRMEGQMGHLTQWMIILGSFGFILFYFVLYPYYVAYKNGVTDAVEEAPVYIAKRKLELYATRDLSDVFNDTFTFLRWMWPAFSKFLFRVLLPLNLLYCVIYFGWGSFEGYYLSWSQKMSVYFAVEPYFEWGSLIVCGIIASLLITFVHYAFMAYRNQSEKLDFTPFFRFYVRHGWKNFLFAAILMLLFCFAATWIIILCLFFIPIILYWTYAGIDGGSFAGGIGKGFSDGGNAWGLNLGNILIFSFIGFFGFLYGVGIINELLVESIINWFVYEDGKLNQTVRNISETFIYTSVFYFFISLMFIAFTLTYYVVQERIKAVSLYKRLEEFGLSTERKRRQEGDF